jgi:hypothetical protein
VKKNFRTADAVAIQIDALYIDLHNDFSLKSLEINFPERTFRISFLRITEPQNSNSCQELTLTFLEIDYLSASPGLVGPHGHGISELGYKAPLDLDHHWLMSEAEASPLDHLFLRFDGDEFIRLHSAQVQAKVEHFPSV